MGLTSARLPADAAAIEMERTHLIGFGAAGGRHVQVPLSLDPGIDLRRTTYLSRMIQRWGKLPLGLLSGLDLKNHRYGFIGTEDWSMYPLLQPGSLVLVDESRSKIVNSGWASEFERPIYFLEHRGGYACALVSPLREPTRPSAAPSFHVQPRGLQLPDGYRRDRAGCGRGYASGSGSETSYSA